MFAFKSSRVVLNLTFCRLMKVVKREFGFPICQPMSGIVHIANIYCQNDLVLWCA